MRVWKAGVVYFALVFAVGFACGLVRVPVLVPKLGERLAELLETPILLVAIVLASGWISRRFLQGAGAGARLGAGLVALALILVVELTVVLAVRGTTPREYVEHRDPVAGAVYVAMLLVFALAPLARHLVTFRVTKFDP